MKPESWLAIVGLVIGVGSMVFAAWQATLMRRQTETMAAQTDLLGKQTALGIVTAELSFNRDVMSWLQDVLFRIAADKDVHAHVWGAENENNTSQVAVQSINDVLSMALAAVERLPDFSRQQGEDWYSYASYVMDKCPSVRAEVLAHPDWWPELTPWALRVEAAATAAREPTAPNERPRFDGDPAAGVGP